MTGTALELGRRIATRALDPVELCEAALERAACRDARASFITITGERARAEAEASRRRHRDRRPRSRLDGVPIAWKDLVDLRGAPTTAGSTTRECDTRPEADAEVVRQAVATGLVSIGKTNLTEFAFSGLGLNPHFGTPDNPAAPGLIPGGSSAGSAAAVAAGVVPWAVGTDTSGSVRVPAALCGLVGYRPTAGRISTAGVFPLAPSLDTVGPITRSVADAGALEAALRGATMAATLEGLPQRPGEIIVPTGPITEGIDTEVVEVVAAAVDRLGRHGARIHPIPLPELGIVQRLFATHGTLVEAEAYRTHAERLRRHGALRIDPRVRDRLLGGRQVLAQGYETLRRQRPVLIRAIAARLGTAILAHPTVPISAPPLSELTGDQAAFHRANSRTLSLTMILSYLDLASITLPAGTTPSGSPVGLCLSASPGGDEHLLTAAHAVETILRK